ncbi:MAG: riboflavin synthase [Chloroflexi bacterium]|nr:riboflavin synthase [Chloroflexota bacterium]
MFSGIVEEVGEVVEAGPGLLAVRARKTWKGVRQGDSLSVNGVCLTVRDLDDRTFVFDLMPETLRRTSLGNKASGDGVNLERALQLSDRLGGHIVQGHVDGRGEVLSVVPEGNARVVRFRAPRGLLRYIVEKGFIAVDGVSLTVVSVDKESFSVSLVDYTLRNTTLGTAKPGDFANLEVDILAKYVERLLGERERGS